MRTGSWTGPPRGKRAPRVGISSTVFGVRLGPGPHTTDTVSELPTASPPGPYRGTSLIRNSAPLGLYSRTLSRALFWWRAYPNLKRLFAVPRGSPLVSGFRFRILVSGCGLWVSGFGLRVSGFGFQVSGFRFRASGFEIRASGFGLRISGFGLRVLGFGFRVSLSYDELLLQERERARAREREKIERARELR